MINGKNGVGKSLLLKLFFLKILPSNGDIYLYGKKINENEKINILEYRKKVGVILQNDYLIPFLQFIRILKLLVKFKVKKNTLRKELMKFLIG